MHIWSPSLLYLLSSSNKISLLTWFHMQLQEHIFTGSNKLIKSIQVFLNVFNELRLCHVMEKSSSLQMKRESSKVGLLNHSYSLYLMPIYFNFLRLLSFKFGNGW